MTKHLQRRKYLQTERKNGLSQSHQKKRWLWLTRTFTRSRSVLNTTHNNSRIHSIHALKRLNVILCGSTANVGAAASNMWRARGYPTISRFVLCNLTYFQSIREVLFRWCFLWEPWSWVMPNGTPHCCRIDWRQCLRFATSSHRFIIVVVIVVVVVRYQWYHSVQLLAKRTAYRANLQNWKFWIVRCRETHHVLATACIFLQSVSLLDLDYMLMLYLRSSRAECFSSNRSKIVAEVGWLVREVTYWWYMFGKDPWIAFAEAFNVKKLFSDLNTICSI